MVTMESSQRPLAIDSFSSSWLIHTKPSSDDSLVDDQYNETHHDFTEWTLSKRFPSNTHDFSFDSNFSNSTLFVVHADELFSNGIVMPIFVNPSNMEASDFIAESPPPPAINAKESSTGALTVSVSRRGKYRRSSKIFHKYFHKYVVSFFLKPLYQKFRNSSRFRTIKAESVSRSIGRNSPSRDVSPQNGTSSSNTDWSGIDEAILHCKRSLVIGEERRN